MNKKKILRRQLEQPSAQPLSTNPLLQRILAQRGIKTDEEIDHSLKRLFSPECLRGLNSAIQVLAEAIMEQRHIMVVGDFDADGATSTVVAVLALQAFGAAQVSYLVPSRFKFGYGLTPEIVEVAGQKSPRILVTVDNGISSIEGVDAANQAGMQVVVTDHHLPGKELPKAAAIVNPNQPGCEFPSKNLAGVGVIFYVMAALRAHLLSLGWFEQIQKDAPNMAQFLDLVAVGTVADVVPLDQTNRILVHQGLLRIRGGACRPGISALLKLAKRNPKTLISSDLGFAVGPRLNAAGRLDDMSLGIACFLEEDAGQAQAMAEILDGMNQDRRNIERDMQEEALSCLDHLKPETMSHGLCLYQESWHQGVIGILASRLKERFCRPAIVFAQANEQELKGSARSVKGVHMRDVLAGIDAQSPGLIEKFGGHAMAAGLTLKKENFPLFAELFNQYLAQRFSEEDLSEALFSDGPLEPEFFSVEVAQLLREAYPWGQHFEEPLFDGVFNVVRHRIVGEQHVKLLLAEPVSGKLVEAIAFNAASDWPGQPRALHFAFRLGVNDYGGRKQLQLIIEHFQECETEIVEALV